MDPPILAIEGHDVAAFATPAAMTLKLEATDVRDGVYKVYDSTGHAIELGIGDDDRERVTIRSVREPASTDELRVVLLDALAATGLERGPLEDLGLPALVALVVERFGIDS